MNVQTDRQTDEIHRYHVYVGLAQARPNNACVLSSLVRSEFYTFSPVRSGPKIIHYLKKHYMHAVRFEPSTSYLLVSRARYQLTTMQCHQPNSLSFKYLNLVSNPNPNPNCGFESPNS